MMDGESYTVKVRKEDGSLWAEVSELPGCFATGDTWTELGADLGEAIKLYLTETPNGR